MYPWTTDQQLATPSLLALDTPWSIAGKVSQLQIYFKKTNNLKTTIMADVTTQHVKTLNRTQSNAPLLDDSGNPILFTRITLVEARAKGFKFTKTILQGFLTEKDANGLPIANGKKTDELSKPFIWFTVPKAIAELDGSLDAEGKPLRSILSIKENVLANNEVGKPLNERTVNLQFWVGKNKTSGEEGMIYNLIPAEEELS